LCIHIGLNWRKEKRVLPKTPKPHKMCLQIKI